MEKTYLIKDIDKKEIKEGELFSFKFLETLGTRIDLKGSLIFNEEDLAYEIDVIDNERYVCLTYATCSMLISNIKKL